MSHIRNLFNDPGRRLRPTAGAALAEPAGARAPSASFAGAPPPSSAAPALKREFPVVQARIGPEIRLVTHSDPRSSAVDRYRYLRMRLREAWSTGKLRKLMVTSPIAQDGKTTVVMNLAGILCERGSRSVLVVEGDLHRSTIAQSLGLSSAPGLTECLTGDADPLDAVQRIEPLGWNLLQAGEPLRTPTELLQPAALSPVVQKLAPYFDWILIDSPPVVPITDALLLQQQADACLLVVRAGRTPRALVDKAVELLGKQHIAGILLNAVEIVARPYGYYERGGESPDY